jgi:hypothetical protein
MRSPLHATHYQKHLRLEDTMASKKDLPAKKEVKGGRKK